MLQLVSKEIKKNSKYVHRGDLFSTAQLIRGAGGSVLKLTHFLNATLVAITDTPSLFLLHYTKTTVINVKLLTFELPPLAQLRK